MVMVVAPLRIAWASDLEASAPARTQLLAFEGRWQKIQDPKDDEARLSAIDRSLRSLSWIVRKMASGVLSRTTVPDPELEFVWDGERLNQIMKGKAQPTVRPIEFDGDFLERLDDRGVPFFSAWVWTGDGLRVVWKQNQAHGSNLYRVDPRTGTLVVEHTIEVTAISNIDPIVYVSRFHRAMSSALSAASRGSDDAAVTDLR
jgi:hypothetical protein